MTTFGGVALDALDDVAGDRMRCLIIGPQGAGKTTLASTIAEVGPTLLIDLVGERGLGSIKGSPHAKNIKVARPATVQALDDIFWKLDQGDHPFEAVILDSASAVQKLSMKFIMGYSETSVREIQRGVRPPDQGKWGQTLEIMTDLATFWYGLADGGKDRPIHVIMTAQVKYGEDEEGNMTRQPDVQKGAVNITKAAPDYILFCDLEDVPEALGDDDAVQTRHIVRFGNDPTYSTKARVPIHLRGKLPPILGRERPLTLPALGRALEVGGFPAKQTRKGQTSDDRKDS